MSATLGQVTCCTAISTNENAEVEGRTAFNVLESAEVKVEEQASALKSRWTRMGSDPEGTFMLPTVDLSGEALEGLESASATTLSLPGTYLTSAVNSAMKAKCRCCLADQGGETR